MAEPPGLPPGKHHHNNTLNAVSFGFIATAVLFAMFLIMAIFERVLRPHRAAYRARGPTDEELQAGLPPPASDSHKPEFHHVNSYSRSVSVLMPGNEYPTYFAKPIMYPLAPEGVDWPAHAESSQHDADVQRARNQKGPTLGRTFSNASERWQSFRKGNNSSSS